MQGFFQALGYGATVAIIGILIVFVGLALLILSIMAMAEVFKMIGKAKEAKAAAPAPVVEQPQSVVAAPVAESVVEEVVDDAELIAVIAAALAAFDNSGKSLVVRKVRRVSGWNRSSREEQVYRF